ncbi:MAG: hypothetical protein JWN41_1025, partial [Thermoleophilia bacterium]|nr:hypothetical protein [Thermoleophilia bacterium]
MDFVLFMPACRSLLVAAATLAVITFAAPCAAFAALPPDGAPWTEIGGGTGWVSEDGGAATGESMTVALQSDGKIVTGESAEPGTSGVAQVTRRTRDGALDPAFGLGGHAQIVVGPGTTAVQAVALDSLQRIVAVGSYDTGGPSGTNAFALRLLSDGSPDPAFGVAGVSQIELCSNYDDAAYALTIRADDGIVAGGYSRSGCDGSSIRPEAAVFELTPAGALDPAFATGGVLDQYPAVDTPSQITSLDLDAGGNIVAGGQSYFGNPGFVLRILPTGSYDPAFGAGGETSLPDLRWVGDVLPQPDGTTLVSGEGLSSNGVAQRLLADGSIDVSYGTAGVASTFADHFFSLGPIVGNLGAARQSDGSLLLCGAVMDIATFSERYYDLGAIRFTPDGQLDTSFGVAGYAAMHTAAWEQGDEAVGDCELDADGRLVVAGFTSYGVSGADYRAPAIAGWQARADFTAPTALVSATGAAHTVTFDVTAVDGGSGIEDVTGAYSFDGGDTWQTSPQLQFTDLLPGTTKGVVVVVRDRSGNLSVPATADASTTADSDAPSATVAVTAAYGSLTYAVTASDEAAGLGDDAYSFDSGETWGASSTFVRAGLAPGTTYDLAVLVRDRVGNVTALVASAATLVDGSPVIRRVTNVGRVPRGAQPRYTRVYDVDNSWGAVTRLTATFRGATVQLVGGVLDLRRLPEGTGTLVIRALDDDGDEGVLKQHLRIDRTAPVVALRGTHFALGGRVTVHATDAGAGVVHHTLSIRLPRHLGDSVIQTRVADRDGNASTQRIHVTRRLALGDQRLNFGLRLRTSNGSRVDPTLDAVRASFRFIGTEPPWYAASDLQTPFVAE